MFFEVGDIVTRDGTDEHEIIEINHDQAWLIVECIKEPKTKWIKKGERESNLIKRYILVRKEVK